MQRDALSIAMDEIAKADKAAIERDKETAKVIVAGGVDGLRKFCDLLRSDIAGFELQVWEGRKSKEDLSLDDLIAMRAYALRIIARAEFYINIGTASKQEAPEK